MPKKDSFNVLAIVLIILGLLLFLDTMNIVPGIMLFWPFLVFIFGLGFCLLFYRRRKKDLILLGMGAFITLCSFFFMYLNIIGWHTLSYLWPVFPGILGASFLPPYVYSKNRAVLYMGVLLMATGAAFILIFSISTQLWPVSLIIAGGSFLILGYFGKKR